MTDLQSVSPPAQEAAPGVPKIDAKAVNAKDNRSLYKAREPIYPKLVHGKFRTIKWAVMIVIAWHLLRLALDPAGSRPRPSRSGLPARFRPSAALFLLARNLGAGILLRYRHSGTVGACPVPCYRAGRTGVVRLCLPPDGVDRSHDHGSSASGRAIATRACGSPKRRGRSIRLWRIGGNPSELASRLAF